MLTNKITTLINKEIEAIKKIPNNGSMEAAVNLMYQQVHKGAGKIVVSGVGKAGLMGMKIAATLSSTGSPACYLSPLDAQHGDLGLLQKDDLLFVISNSGETREIIELCMLAKNLDPNIPIIVMSKKTEGTIVDMATVNIETGENNEICPLGMTPTTSTTVMGIIGDIIVVLLMEKINFTKKEYGLRHHSGYLGRQARKD